MMNAVLEEIPVVTCEPAPDIRAGERGRDTQAAVYPVCPELFECAAQFADALERGYLLDAACELPLLM